MSEISYTYQELRQGPPEKMTKETQQLLSQYLQCTDGLIGKMDGTIPIKDTDVYTYDQDTHNFENEKKDLPPPETIIFLDKSARPVSWLVREFWAKLARLPGTRFDEQQVPKMPDFKFLNIDKRDWLRFMSIPEQHIQDASDEILDFSLINPEEIARIRAVFSTQPITESNLQEAWQHPTILNGQHTMIVDEVMSSGLTLEIALKLLAMAVPEATFSGQYWAKPSRIPLNNGIPVDGKIQYQIEWVPVWYNPEHALGRGIGDRDPDWPETVTSQGREPTRLSTIGRNILSTQSHNLKTGQLQPDLKARRIREDIHTMVEALEHGDLLYNPSPDRPTDTDEEFSQFVNRIETLNNMSFSTWQERRNQPISSQSR